MTARKRPARDVSRLSLVAPLDEVDTPAAVAELPELARRLHQLSDAIVQIAALGADEVLHALPGTAAELAGARFAELQVVRHARGSPRRWHRLAGGDAPTAGPSRLHPGPTDLDRLVAGRQPRREYDLVLADANDPCARSYLGVPLFVGGQPFGALSLWDKRGGDSFSGSDEQIVVSLAAAAGLAVGSARRQREARAGRLWVEAAASLTTRLLAGAALAEVLPEVVSRARTLAGADVALLALPQHDETLRVVASDGRVSPDVVDTIIVRESLAAQVLREGVPRALADAREDPRVLPGLIDAVSAGPALYVPLGDASQPVGTLVVARGGGSQPFDEAVVLVVQAFANQAAIALRLGAAAADRQLLAVLGDRDRIARDLHDVVVQRLFATALSLEVSLQDGPASTGPRVQAGIAELQETIEQIRATVYALRSPSSRLRAGVRGAVVQTVEAAVDALGFEPDVIFDGPVDTLVPIPVAEHLIAVVGEALSNIARHARATSAQVRLRADLASLQLLVVDDGIGIGAGDRRSGLDNMVTRAVELGGTAAVTAAVGGGTQVRWAVPLG